MDQGRNGYHDDEIEIRDQSGDPFTAVWNWLLDSMEMTGTEKLVWIALKSYAGCPEIRPSVKSLARRASVSIRTAQRTIDALSKKGLVRVERRSRPDGGDATNRYILLPFPNRKDNRRPRDMVTPAPGCHGDTPPGARTAAPRMTPCHPKENIKLIKDNTTTTSDDVVVSLDDIKELIRGTPFQKIDDMSLRMFVGKYGAKRAFESLDRLIETYKISGKKIVDSMGILAIGLLKGVTTPAGYVPYQERKEIDRSRREAAERIRIAEAERKQAEQENYKAQIALFDALPELEREMWLNRARAELSGALKDSKYAVKSKAIELFRGS